jgi:molecular chaperone GrpE
MTHVQHADDEQPEDGNATDSALREAVIKIADLEKKAAEAQDKMLRALAESENVRRRGEKDRQDTAKFAVSAFARDMLSVADNLRRALVAISPEAREKNPELRNIHAGVEATERELLRALESNGIKRIDPLGEKFDPNLHEVMFETATSSAPPGTVVQVIDPCYMIHERLLRPARVGVAKGMEVVAGVDEEV